MGVYWLLILFILRVSGDVFMGIHDPQKRLGLMKPLVDEFAIDSKITIDYSPDKGIYVLANRALNENEKVVRMPESYIMSVFDNFPFKETCIDALTQFSYGLIDGLLIQVCQVLVNLNTNRQEIEQAIDGYNDFELYVENWALWRNYLYSMPDKEVLDTPVIWDKQDNEYWENIVDKFMSLDYISDLYDNLLVVLEKTKTPKATFLKEKVLISKEQFLWAYMIINSKGFASSYDEYLVMSQNKPKKNKQNHQLNKKYFKDAGVYMMPVADFVNQIHPTKRSLSDIIDFSINKERGYANLSVSRSFKAGEEYGFLYSPHLSSISLVATHGYAIEDNILEELVVSIRNEFFYLRPESKIIWMAQKCLPEEVRFLTRNNIEQNINGEEIHFNFRRRDKYDEHFLDFWRIAVYNRLYNNKFGQFLDDEKTHENKITLDSMFAQTFMLYLKNIFLYGYLSFYSELSAMSQVIKALNEYLSLKPDELPDPDSLPRRKAVCVTAAISQRNMFYNQIRNLMKRTSVLIITQILNEF